MPSGPARSPAIRYAAIAAAVAVAGAVAAFTLFPSRSRRVVRGGDGGPETEGATAEWCAEGLAPIPGEGCFAAPPQGGATALLVYLHGRYAPEGAADERERQARVARMGVARGYAVLALRGRQGQCTDPQLAAWWCWPSNERNAATGPEFVARWATALGEAERRIGGKRRRVLLGFSNGAYFASLIASRALAPFDAVAIAHGGPVQPMTPVGPMPPILLVDADDDASTTEMQRLDADLARESWPHALVVREGGHALPDWDVGMALTFFDRTVAEKLPLTPPLSTRARRPPRDPDASDPELDPGLDAASTAAPTAAAPSAAAADAEVAPAAAQTGVPAEPAAATATATAAPAPAAPAPAAPTAGDPVLDPPP